MPTGPGDVLQLIRRGEAATRGELQRTTGLARMTVAQRVDALLDAALVLEGPTGEATGGRRPRSLHFNAEHGLVVAVTVDTTHTRMALTDLAGRILDNAHVDVKVASGPQRTLSAVVEAARTMLDRNDIAVERLAAVGISVPGPVDPHTGRPSQPPIMPGWDGYPITEQIRELLPDVAVVTANDADVAALGEHAISFPTARALCLVKVDTGIGSGIVIDGAIYRGTDGGAGDIGHVRLRGRDALCQCGGHGCLAAVASGGAVASQLNELGVTADSGRDVGRLLAAGSPDAGRLTRQAGRLIGEVMATMVCVLNPEVVLVGGALASAPLLTGMRETLYQLSLPRATRHLTLQLGTLDEDAAVVGLSRLVADTEYSADAVNALLAGEARNPATTAAGPLTSPPGAMPTGLPDGLSPWTTPATSTAPVSEPDGGGQTRAADRTVPRRCRGAGP